MRLNREHVSTIRNDAPIFLPSKSFAQVSKTREVFAVQKVEHADFHPVSKSRRPNFSPLSFSVLSLPDRVFDTLRQNSPVLSSRPGPRTQERLITVHPFVPPSARRGSVRFSGTRVWKIQFSGHVLRCQLGARWDV